MSPPLVTIVIPTKDRHAFLRGAVRSALSQSVSDIEVIVVDDGSAVPVHDASGDPRLRIVRNERSIGVAASRNVGLREAKGLFITYLDDDDELLPHMVQVSLDAISNSSLPPPVAALAAMMVVNADGSIAEVRSPVTLPRGSNWSVSAVETGTLMALRQAWNTNSLLAPAAVLREIGGWDERFIAQEHMDLYLRLHPACSLQRVEDVCYRALNHSGKRLSRRTIAAAEAILLIDQKHAGMFRGSGLRRARRLSTAAMYFLKGNRWELSVRTSTRALLCNPSSRRLWIRLAASLCGPVGLSVYRGTRSRLRMARTRWRPAA